MESASSPEGNDGVGAVSASTSSAEGKRLLVLSMIDVMHIVNALGPN